jgi:hypothetical protein
MQRYRATTTTGQTWLFLAENSETAHATAVRMLIMRCPKDGETVETVAEDLPQTEHERGIVLLAEAIQREQRAEYARQYGESNADDIHWHGWHVTIKPGRKYVNVDVGQSGKYMVDESGDIYGIKAYGVIHRGYRFGTLATVAAWDWSGYRAKPRGAR